MHIAKLILVCGGAMAAGVSANALRPAIAPAPLAMTVADDAPRPWLGVNVRDTPAALAAQLGIDRASASLIESVVQGSPAAKAGLEQYDLVLGAGDGQTLAEALRNSAPGDRLTLHILRAGEKISITVKLGERPAGDGEAPAAPPVRVDLEDGDARAFGVGVDREAAQRAAEEAMRQAKQAMKQARRAIEQQDWAEDLDLDFGDLNFPEIDFGEMEFGEFDFENAFDHEAFAKQMEALAQRHEQQMAQIEEMISQRLEPAMKALEVYLEKVMAVISRESNAALGGPLAQRLADALDDADIDATAEEIEGAVRRFIENIGMNINDGEMSISSGAERIERSLAKALEKAGVDVDDLGDALGGVAAWLDDWSAQMSEDGAAALEKLEAEFEKHKKELEGLAPDAPEAPPAPEPSLAQPTSGGKA
jgi:hypothetical protein